MSRLFPALNARPSGPGCRSRHIDMRDDDRSFFWARSLKNLQNNVERAGPAAAASYTLIGAIILLGGLGYLVDRWLGSAPWGLLAGLLLGIVVGFYELAMAVWKR